MKQYAIEMSTKQYNCSAACWVRLAIKTAIKRDHPTAGRTARRMLWQAGRALVREMTAT
jgi:hypothetical protein